MATPTLDLTLGSFMIPIFVFLLIFAISYALLLKTDIIGKNKILALIISLCLAAVTSFAGRISTVFELALPWVVIVLVLGILIFSFYEFFGEKKETPWKFMGKPMVILILAGIFVLSLIVAYEDILSPYGGGTEASVEEVVIQEVELENGTVVTQELQKSSGDETLKALVHPRILGAMFILLVAAVAVKFLADKIN